MDEGVSPQKLCQIRVPLLTDDFRETGQRLQFQREIKGGILVDHSMTADLHRLAADLRFPVALYGLLEGPPPLLRDLLPLDLTVHLIAVIPATVGVAGLIGEGWQDTSVYCGGISTGTRSR